MATIEEHARRHGGMLYPALLIAAVLVIVLSVVGIALMTGVLSGAQWSGEPVKTHLPPPGKSVGALHEAPDPERWSLRLG